MDKEVVKYRVVIGGDAFEQIITWINSDGCEIYKYIHYGMEDEDKVLFDYRDSDCIYQNMYATRRVIYG